MFSIAVFYLQRRIFTTQIVEHDLVILNVSKLLVVRWYAYRLMYSIAFRIVLKKSTVDVIRSASN